MFGDGPDGSCIIFKSSRLSRAVILINKYVNKCKYLQYYKFICSIVLGSRDFVDVNKSYRT